MIAAGNLFAANAQSEGAGSDGASIALTAKEPNPRPKDFEKGKEMTLNIPIWKRVSFQIHNRKPLFSERNGYKKKLRIFGVAFEIIHWKPFPTSPSPDKTEVKR